MVNCIVQNKGETLSKRLVILTYFKGTGKFYTDGAYVSEKEIDYEIYDEVKTMQQQNNLPGLTGSWDGYCLIDPELGVRHLLDFTEFMQ